MRVSLAVFEIENGKEIRVGYVLKYFIVSVSAVRMGLGRVREFVMSVALRISPYSFSVTERIASFYAQKGVGIGRGLAPRTPTPGTV